MSNLLRNTILDCTGIKYLCFCGGGLRGGAFAAALDTMQPVLPWKQIKGCVGTSIGALIAYMVASHMRPKQIIQTFTRTSLVPCSQVGDMWEQKSLVNLDVYYRTINDIISFGGAFPSTVTFKQHFHDTQRHLVIVTTALETYKPLFLDHVNSPHMPIHTALCASMSIPAYFPVVKHGNKTLVDGAYTINFPFGVFPMDQTLGFWLNDVKKHEVSGFRDILYHSLMCALTSLDEIYHKRIVSTHAAHVVNIHVPQSLALKFNMPNNDVRDILRRGHRTAVEHLLRFTALPQMMLLLLWYRGCLRIP